MTSPPKTLLRRIANILLVFPLALLVLAFNLLGQPGLAAVISAHVCLYSGFALAVVADRLARLPFQRMLVVYHNSIPIQEISQQDLDAQLYAWKSESGTPQWFYLDAGPDD